MKILVKLLKVRTVTAYSMLVLIVLALFGCEKSTTPVVLKFTSWRAEDVAEMNRINDLFTATHPD